jgi:hypothetical protein
MHMKKLALCLLTATILIIRPVAGQNTNSDSRTIKKSERLCKKIDSLRGKIEKSDADSSCLNLKICKLPFKDQYGLKPDFFQKGVLFYDFNGGQFYFDNKLVRDLTDVTASYKKEFRIEVININRYNYNVNLTADNVTFGSQQPELFKQLFLGEGSFATGLVSALKPSQANVTGVMQADTGTMRDRFNKKLQDFLDKYYNLLELQMNVYRYCSLTDGSCLVKKSKTDSFTTLAKNLLDLKLDYQAMYDEVIKKIEKLEKGTRNKPDSIELARCKDFKKSLENSWTMIPKVTEKDLLKLTFFADNYVSDHFKYVSPPIYPDGNTLKIGLRFTPSDSSLVKKFNIMPLRNDSIGLEIFVRKKWHSSFSSGPFTVFGKNMIYEEYGWQAQPGKDSTVIDSSRYKLVSTGKRSVSPGIAAFVNMGFRCSEKFGWALSTGVGITIEEKPRPVYFLGGTLNFGKNEVLSLTSGIVLVNVDKLNSSIYPDHETAFYIKPGAVSYSKELKVGGFISLSYTLFTSNRTRNSTSGSMK